MDFSFWEAALILTLSFITVCVLYYWCTSTCCQRSEPELDIDDSMDSNQRTPAIFTITTVLMGDSRSTTQRYTTTRTNAELVPGDYPPTYEEAVRRIRVS
ncbi:unnamed protein product [Hermetia illucens]|uniref:Uncharacterized protein n=2 Tax=Hermetia illucens TaxID=343691 RepID=A0A7R8UCJ8_HERIL|nr:unnamed protein product [Hermetia illucens]